MRKTLLFLSVIGLLMTSCEKTNSSKNSEWMISIAVDGVEHKAEGTVDNSYLSMQSLDNIAYTGYPQVYGSSFLYFNMMDKSDESYVKGDNFQFGLTKFSGLDEGNNEFIFSLQGLGMYGNDNIFIPGATITPGWNDTININITDLGTPTEIDPTDVEGYYDFGKPVKGNGSGNLNFSYEIDNNYRDTVLNIEIDFIAVRYN